MKMSSVSIGVFSAYLGMLAVFFIVAPNPLITLFGFSPTNEIWIRILGYMLGAMGFLYGMALKERNLSFYRWSVYARLPIFPLFGIFVLTGAAPIVLIVFGAFDTGCALWTWYALHKENQATTD